MKDNKSIQEKILKVQDIYENIGMEPLSILLGYDKNKIGKIYNNYIDATDEFENQMDMILKKPKFRIKLLQKYKYKITRKSTIVKIEKIIKNADNEINFKNILKNVENSMKKVSHELKKYNKYFEYIDNVINSTRFKPQDFGKNNNTLELKEIQIDIYTSIVKKLNKIQSFYKDYTQDEIINTLLYEKAEQFLNEKAQGCSIKRIDSTEKINEMINYYEDMLLGLEDERKITPKKGVEDIINMYGISKKDLSKLLGCSEMTILRYSQNENTVNEENQYYEKLRKLRFDSYEMLKLLEAKKKNGDINLKNYKKYKEKIKSKGFKEREAIEQLGEKMIRLNEDQLNMILCFLKSENTTQRIALQDLIDERSLAIIKHSKIEVKEPIMLKLYPEVMEKIIKLNCKYPKLNLNDIINTLLEKKLEQYVTYRIDISSYEKG